MSKLFNIVDIEKNDIHTNNMFGGTITDIKTIRTTPYESSGSDVIEKLIANFEEKDYNDFENKITDNTLKKNNENFEEWKKRFGKYLLNNGQTGKSQGGFYDRNRLYDEIKKMVFRNIDNQALQNPLLPTPNTPTAITPTIQNATGCIHIGIIDTDGTFVGVHSVADTEKPLFTLLKPIADNLKLTIKNQPVASIYDKFIDKSDTGCIPTFVDKYITKFWDSKELAELYGKYQKEKVTDLSFTINSTQQNNGTTVQPSTQQNNGTTVQPSTQQNNGTTMQPLTQPANV